MSCSSSSDDENLFLNEIFNEWSSTTSSELTESTSSDEEVPRKIVRVVGFAEVTVPQFDHKQFQLFIKFRLSKTTADCILKRMCDSNVGATYKAGRENVPLEKMFLMRLWYLANQETYRQISDRFNVSQSTALICIRKVVKYLVEISHEYIKWPNGSEGNAISVGFEQKQGFKGVIGAIDGSHISIKKPKDQMAYCNRKGTHSIILQAVADHRRRLIDVFCGEAGSVHDARVLKRSHLYKRAETQGLPQNKYLLGDSAYPNLSWLVVPFKDNGRLSNEQKTFNYKYSSTRIVIEHTFALLKGRFRRLFHFENNNLNFVVSAVIAACVLHNICIDSDDLEVEIGSHNYDPDITPEYNVQVEEFQEADRRNAILNDIL